MGYSYRLLFPVLSGFLQAALLCGLEIDRVQLAALSWCYGGSPAGHCKRPVTPASRSRRSQTPATSPRSFPCPGVLYSCQPEQGMLSPLPRRVPPPAFTHTLSACGSHSSHCHADGSAPPFRAQLPATAPSCFGPLQLGAITPSSQCLLGNSSSCDILM